MMRDAELAATLAAMRPRIAGWVRVMATELLSFHSEQDLTQEVLHECLRDGGALQRLDANRELEPWVRGVVRNVLLRHRRDRARQRARALASREEASRERAGLSTVLDAELAERYWRRAWADVADGTTTVRHRTVSVRQLLELRWRDGATPLQIVDELELPAGAASQKAVSAALSRLKRRLQSTVRQAIAADRPDLPKAQLDGLVHELMQSLRNRGVG